MNVLLLALGLYELGAVFLLGLLWLALGTALALVLRWTRRHTGDPRGL